MNNLNEICNYIIKSVQNNSVLSGFQYCIYFEDIEKHFNISLHDSDVEDIYKSLKEAKEVADILVYDDLFDVVLYTDYCFNYININED